MSVGTYGSALLGQEVTYGTPVIPSVAQEINEESLKADSALLIPKLITHRRVERRVLPNAYGIDGNLNFPLFPNGFTGWIFKGIMGGTPVTTTLAPGVYQHVFKVGNTIPSFTIDINRLAAQMRFSGCKFGSLGLSIEKTKLVEAVLGIVGRKDQIATIAAPTFSDIDPFAGINVSVELNGVANADVEKADITLANDLEKVYTLDGTRYLRKIQEKTFTADGSFTMEFGDKTMLELFWGEVAATEPQLHLTSGALKFIIEQDVEVVVGSGYNFKTMLDFTRVYWKSHEPFIKADERVIQNIGFHPVQDLVTDEVLTVTVINDESGYPNP